MLENQVKYIVIVWHCKVLAAAAFFVFLAAAAGAGRIAAHLFLGALCRLPFGSRLIAAGKHHLLLFWLLQFFNGLVFGNLYSKQDADGFVFYPLNHILEQLKSLFFVNEQWVLLRIPPKTDPLL